MARPYEVSSALDTNVLPTQRRAFGPNGEIAPLKGWSDQQLLSNRLAGLSRQRSDVQQRTAFLNTSPLGETSHKDAQDMVDLSQSIAALGQKVTNPNKAVQFAAEPRISTMPNATQEGVAMDRSRGNLAGLQRQAAQAQDLEIGNTENELSTAQDMADPSFGDVAGAQARYGQGAGRRTALARMYGR